MSAALRRSILAVVAGALLLGAPSVGAQTPGRDRVQIALETTDARIQMAETVVGGADLPPARLELDTAVEIQGRARSSFNGQQLALSLRLTLDSRGHADRAIALVRGLPDPDRVRVQIERSREMIDRARERIEECERPRARALIASALSMQARSEENVEAGRYLAALQLSMGARERALRALRLCDMNEDEGDAAERALQRTDQLLARAQDALAERPAPMARAAFERAQRLQEQARGELRAERTDAALRLTQTARTFAHRAIRLATAGV